MYSEIHNELFDKYVKKKSLNKETSSHWKYWLKQSSIIKKNDKYIINSLAISTVSKKNLISFFKNLIISLLLKFYINKNSVPKYIVKINKSLNDKLNFYFSFDQAKNMIIYKTLNTFKVFKKKTFVCIIGDGHGHLGILIKKLHPDVKIIYVNLGKNLLIDSYHYFMIFSNHKPLLLKKHNLNKINDYSMFLIEAENYSLIQSINIDIFINVASMQEMDIKTINNYFMFMRNNPKESFFYCCNRVSKTLADKSVIKFNDYPWSSNDLVFLNEKCDWYTKFPILFPPFWKSFDGEIKHKLVKFKKKIYA